MTLFRSIVITDDSLQIIEHGSEEKAEDFELRIKSDLSYGSHAYGDINGKSYTVVYYKKEQKV